MQTVMVVDDQRGARRALAAELEDAGFHVVQAANGVDAWQHFRRERPDLVITDLVMPRSDGVDLVIRIRTQSDVPVIIFTAHGTVETAVSALKSGADEFVSSSDLDLDDLVGLVSRSLVRSQPPEGGERGNSRLVGNSPAVRRVRESIAGLAPLRTPVLIAGEAGTGREAVARIVHETGSSGIGEFLPLEAADFAPNDARLQRAGAIYLREIQGLSKEAQRHWARVLSNSEPKGFRGVPRLLASTSESLRARATEQRFDPFLARMLTRFQIHLPPLRQRLEDVPEVAATLVEEICRTLGRGRVHLSREAISFLRTEKWRGNITQLRDVLERAIVLSRTRELRRKNLERAHGDLVESLGSIRARHSARELEELLIAIRSSGGNVSRAADMLGKSRSAVYRLISKHGIRIADRD